MTKFIPKAKKRLMMGLFALAAASTAVAAAGPSAFVDGSADLEARPLVPPGFEVTVFAREPLVRQPCSMAFDARGRLFVGMGPQYRNPSPDTPGDRVVMVLDADGDGTAETTREFAAGFNCIQSLAWRGRDLWVANAPDLTRVRDVDGDDVADEYVRIYTDLGNLEHGLHGLNWAPDGRLYMSKGNSKGLNQPDHYAPKVFRDMWGVPTPAGAADVPAPQTFTRDSYRRAYHDPADDWGREGGVLRCAADGSQPELVARGFRNPWDIGFDDGFHWLGTDNDQNEGDRVFAPFQGAHFGWNHPWAAGWTGVNEPHIAPVSGPLFQGSGTGIVFGHSPQFPENYRHVWFINDWLRKTTFVFRPHWDGATLGPQGGDWEEFITGGTSLFRPVDLEFGPDGALWCLGWSRGYGAEFADGEMTNEGRIYRISWKNATPAPTRPAVETATTSELIDMFNLPLPVWRTDAQEELLTRGDQIRKELQTALESGRLTRAAETWTVWTLGRLAPDDHGIDDFFVAGLQSPDTPLNQRLQMTRLLAARALARPHPSLPDAVVQRLDHPEPRLRMEAVLAVAATRHQPAVPRLIDRLAVESDRTVTYAAWQAVRSLVPAVDLKPWLGHAAGGVRRGALLALLEDHALSRSEVEPLREDVDPQVQAVAAHWLEKTSSGISEPMVRGRPLGRPSPAPVAPPAGVARHLSATTGHRYELVPGGLRVGTSPFTDRDLPIKKIPETLEGCDLIRTANDDDTSTGAALLTFETLLPTRIHIAHDTRVRTLPPWLAHGWDRGAEIEADHWRCQLYTRDFPAGLITLGGNTSADEPPGHSHYFVILETLPLAPPTEPVQLTEVLALMPSADAERGAALFHQRGAAGCAACHQMNGHGNVFGPDLSSLGARADARHVIQSIIDPNAVVTEGFNLSLIETATASHAGILLEESGLAVTLGLATGQRQTINKTNILSRQTAPVSAMPSYATALPASAVADIAAWLMSQKSIAPPAQPALPALPASPVAPATPTTPATPSASATGATLEWPAGEGFRFTRADDRLVIAHDGSPVGHYVFRDGAIKRPYFAHAHAPGGRQVTRRHPPIDGQDATDHATMHPGIWLGFGDINGHDFWRNKAAISHERFIDEPAIEEDGRLRFTTVSQLLDATDRPLGQLISRIVLQARPEAHLLRWEAEVQAGAVDLVFGDQEEMGFGARVATALTELNGGVITSSTGRQTAALTWGQPAAWCDYTGVIDGYRCGITLMSHPSNFRPAWWHNRDYGVFVANPFGRAAMKQGARDTTTVKKGTSLILRFAAALHASPAGRSVDPETFYQSIITSRGENGVRASGRTKRLAQSAPNIQERAEYILRDQHNSGR